MESLAQPSVGHFIHSYLFLTGSWIYTQLVNMRRWRPFVLTLKLENVDVFPFDSVYHYPQPFSGNSKWQIAARKIYEAITHSRKNFFVEQIKRESPVLLHAHFGTEGYYHLSVVRTTGLPLITTFYGYDVSRLPRSHPKWRKRYARLFEVGSLFLVEGPYMAQAIVDLGCPSYKIRIQHLGVDLERIPFVPRYIRGDEPVRILMAASFREKKGIPYGIEAFVQAVRRLPNMELRIVGGAKTSGEKKLMKYCRNIARREGIADKVVFLGYIPYHEYLHEMASAHLFLAPSIVASDGDTEGGAPVSVIEASAAGLPVISTWHCDIPEVVLDGKSGLLVAEKDVQALAEAICQLASAPESWVEFGKQGRTHIEKEFNAKLQVEQLEKIYDEVAIN